MRAAVLGALALLAFVPSAQAANLYVSPSGNDGNTCDTPFVPCRTFNGVGAKVTCGDFTIYAKGGTYNSPTPGSDGGAPNIADGHGIIDTSVFPACAHVQIVGSVQPETITAAATIDAGNVGSYTTTPSEFFVQFTANVAWSGYMVDAGYAYVDGGLITNALADGSLMTITAGPLAGFVGPVVSNTVRTINVATHGLAPFTAPPAPTAATVFTLSKPNTVLKAWPAATDAGHAYATTAIYAGGGEPGTTGVYADNFDATLPQQGNVQLFYLDIAGAPEGTNSTSEAVDNFGPQLIDMRYSIITLGAADYAAVNYSGTTSIAASYISGGDVAGAINSGQLWLTGDYLSGQEPVSSHGGVTELASDVFAPHDGAVAVAATDARLNINGVNISMGNTTLATFIMSNSTSTLSDVTVVSDGGAGTYRCGAGGRVRFQGTNSFGLANLFSGDNGVTYVTATTYGTQDGGSAGVHADTNAGTGCGYTSY